MNYNPSIHHRKSIRLKGYDYSHKGLYFITICTHHRIPLFGKIEKGKMILNEYGEIAAEEWEKTPEIRKNITPGQFIIMPNHFHSIIHIEYKIGNKNESTGKFKSPSQTIGAIIRGYKGATTKRINTIHNKINRRTGVLQYAPTEAQFLKEGSSSIEDPSLIGESSSTPRTGVLQYASTENPSLRGESFSEGDSSSKSFRKDSSYYKNKSIWQSNYWEHIIRNEDEYFQIANYIKNNPIKWYNDKLNGGSGNIVMELSPPYGEEIWMNKYE
jgi:putative transposase